MNKENLDTVNEGENNRTALLEGTVVEVLPGGCHVRRGQEQFWCAPRGVLKKRPIRQRNIVAVGDRVLFLPVGPRQGVLEEVLPRRSKLSRPDPFNPMLEHVIAANVDQLVIVVSTMKPPFDREIIDRYLVSSENLNLEAVICVNKMDLLPAEGEHSRAALMQEMKVYSDMGYQVIFTSALEKTGIDAFAAALKGKTSVLAGYSGVGKSTLLNALQPGLGLRVGEVNPKTGRGRHTTVSVKLLPLDIGGYVVDTPGIREFGLWRVQPWEVPKLFRDMEVFAPECRYPKCFHIREEDCAVKRAVEEGRINPVRYKNYLRIMESLTEKRGK